VCLGTEAANGLRGNCMEAPITSEEGRMAEAETIRRAQQGEAEAFEQLYRLHSRKVYLLCLHMVGNPADAEDLTQDAFLQSFRKIQTFRGDSAFSTWLHRLTVNIVLMRCRKKKITVCPMDEVMKSDAESGAPGHEIGERDLRLAGVIDRLNLKRALAQMPSGYRAVFILHDIQGYAHNEIASILGSSSGNSKSQLNRARRRLRELLHRSFRRYSRRKHHPERGTATDTSAPVNPCTQHSIVPRPT
jgi:RNA polymerase sigma-70 factor, ECF subfamily